MKRTFLSNLMKAALIEAAFRAISRSRFWKRSPRLQRYVRLFGRWNFLLLLGRRIYKSFKRSRTRHYKSTPKRLAH